MFHADLHIHSKFSRACSKDCDLEHLAWWALRKGVTVVGTGDFTHPGWADELTENLVPAEPGLFRLRPDLEKRVRRASPPSAQPVRFMLSVEISTIYRRAERTRKVHHLLYAPSFDAANRIAAALARIGNLASDGRPILGLDSRDLLEITLESDPGSYLIPAHVWTPWFAVLGSKSGFDAIADCYADLAGHVFAIETGLSSDPPMNWMCSVLDSYRLVSNSDAHSPPMLGREATTLRTDLDYFAIRRALETGAGLSGTLEFFPEEGKYHLDGHRKCAVRLTPAQTLAYGGNCPECRKPLTVGVLHRVEQLADRSHGFRPQGAPDSENLVQLPQIVSEILGPGPRSKKVTAEVGRLVAALGPELAILREVPAEDIARCGGTLLGEAIARLRRGEVLTDAGYDGEYGTVRLLRPGEIKHSVSVPVLFETADQATGQAADQATGRAGQAADGRVERPPNGVEDNQDPKRLPPPAPRRGGAKKPDRPPLLIPGAAPGRGTGSVLGGLDPEQRAAAAADGPVLIIAGPGTGKTRALTHRIAHLVAERGVAPTQCLAITFTRRAAQELRDRLAALVPEHAAGVVVTTFHGLGLRILREQHDRAGLPEHFGVADEAERLAVATELTGSERDGRGLLAEIARASATGLAGDLSTGPAAECGAVGEELDNAGPGREALRKALLARGLVDFDGLVELAGRLLRDEPELAASYRERWPQISVDEYQDADHAQYTLLRLLAQPDGAGLAVIGDPDQAIYGFRGADVRLFLRFADDYPAAATVRLSRNYRCSAVIVEGARQAIAPATLVPGRELRAVTSGSRASGSLAAERITLHEAADEHAEASWIAAAIDDLLGGSSFHSLDSGRADGYGHAGLGLGDIAILHRTDAQAGPLLQALTRAGLPCQKRSHDRLANRPGVHLLVRQLQLAGAAPAPGSGSGSGSVSGSVEARLRAAVRALTGLLPSAGPEAADVRGAAEVLAPLARRCGNDLGRFLTEISLGAEADAADPRADSVGLLTLHAAKGLEFEVVFVAGCENGLLPLWFPGAAPGRDKEDAEERRLFFVGMTRARSRLFLTCARRRTRWGAEREAGPSPFLAAISPGLITSSAHAPRRRPSGRQLRLL
jgi:DNA helicase-2/ATP-dependent DNA helicase PcrA